MTHKKKLIEVALPLAAINAASAREKSIRHGHPSTLHLWWSRKPLATVRAVLWASLVDDPSSHADIFPTEEAQQAERLRLFGILERLVPWEAASDAALLAEARAEIMRSCDGILPTVLDPFGGGGSIPLEAIRLGLPTFTGDLNPVAVLIQRAMLEIPSRFAGRPPVSDLVRRPQSMWEGTRGLAADVEAYGEWMRQRAEELIGCFYPDATLDDGTKATPVAWIWARAVKSPDPSWPGHVPLVRSWELSTKAGKPVVWIEPVVNAETKSIEYEIRTGGSAPSGNIGRGGGVCVATGTNIPIEYIREEARSGRMTSVLLAVVADTSGGRVYTRPRESDLVASSALPPPSWIPTGTMSTSARHMGPPGFGLTDWSQLFTERQLLALSTYIDLLAEVRTTIEGDAAKSGLSSDGARLRDGGSGAVAYGDAVITYLALGISRLTDMCNALCRWETTRTQVRNLFGRQAIPMVWEFAENNVFNDAGGDFRTSLRSVVRALERLPTGHSAVVAQRDARTRISEVGKSVISTDPPYYDNVPYSDISDFFFVWLRRTLGDVWPDEFATMLTPKADELIADPARAGSKRAAQSHFENGMRDVFAVAAQHADASYPATIFYAFKATETTDAGTTSTGWETFLGGLLEAGYTITATWPMRTELSNRMRAQGSNALASSIVLACRPRTVSAPMATRGEFIGSLRSEMEAAVRLLQLENVAPVDLAQSAIGPGISIFSRYARVVEANGEAMTVRAALGLINEALAEILSGEESEFDSDTRFALTWFEQFGHGPGPFGDADLLARAKDTTVAGVAQAGVISSRDGKVRLLGRSELPAGWNPQTDGRLAVWEITQHLIGALDHSESEAAALLATIGVGLGQRARQLAYLLYGICERKRWADEAAVYNMLVTAWPEIVRLSAMPQHPSEERLF